VNKNLCTILTIIVILALAGGVIFIGNRTLRMRAAISGLGTGNESGRLVALSVDGKTIATDTNNQMLENTATQNIGNLNVSLALSPYPPVGWQEGSFDVTLTDEQGLPINDAKISIDLTMPAMPMPQNTVEAVYTTNRLYHATGMFTMRGLWLIEVIIERSGVKHSIFFEVNL